MGETTGTVEVTEPGSWISRRVVRQSAERWLRQRQTGQSALCVRGDFSRFRGWTEKKGWNVIAVRIDGEDRGHLQQLHRGPMVFEVTPGRHDVQFMGDGRKVLWSDSVFFGDQEVVVAQFRPPGRRPVWTAARDGQWWLYRLPEPSP